MSAHPQQVTGFLLWELRDDLLVLGGCGDKLERVCTLSIAERIVLYVHIACIFVFAFFVHFGS